MTSKPAQRPIEERVQDRDWTRIEAELDAQGFAVIGGLLPQEHCVALAALYADPSRFRSRVVMARLGIRTAFAFDKHFQQFATVSVVP